MRRPVPPLHAIQALLIAASASSFREAAEQLSLTPSAFSRRIQALEEFLGVAMFDRSGPVPRLTQAGKRYCREVEPAMEAIYASTRSLRDSPHRTRLRLMCPPSLAINWLMPRLREYYERPDGQEVDLVVTRDLDALRLGRADIAIASGPRDFEGLVCEPFLHLHGAVVAAPRLAGGRSAPKTPHELHAHRLLGLAPPADLARDLWAGWQRSSAYRGPALAEPLRFETWALMYEAAANGMGVTIAVPAVAENYLREGRLKPCFGGTVSLDVQYQLLYATPELRVRDDVRRLATWLTSEVNGSLENFLAFIGHPTTDASPA